jgi:hypothetical protein
MEKLLACDLSKAKLKFENGFNDLYIAVFDNMSINYYFQERRLRVNFSDRSCLEYCIYPGKKNVRIRDYEYIDQNNNIIEEWSCDDIFSLKVIKLDKFIINLKKVVNEAAAKIQAAFHGWKVRHMYRYDPYNCLGKYLALKRFEEINL